MNREQQIVTDIGMAALTENAAELARLVNNLDDDQVRDATTRALAATVVFFRTLIDPVDWPNIIDGAKAQRLLLELDPT